jgi:hypothetical protein
LPHDKSRAKETRVNRKLIVVVLTAAAVGISAGNASGFARKCGDSGTAIRHIVADRTTCSVARKVAQADIQRKKYDGWKCTSRLTTNAANVTCTHPGGGKVTFRVADKP